MIKFENTIYDIKKIKNINIVGPFGSGKTYIISKILHESEELFQKNNTKLCIVCGKGIPEYQDVLIDNLFHYEVFDFNKLDLIGTIENEYIKRAQNKINFEIIVIIDEYSCLNKKQIKCLFKRGVRKLNKVGIYFIINSQKKSIKNRNFKCLELNKYNDAYTQLNLLLKEFK